MGQIRTDSSLNAGKDFERSPAGIGLFSFSVVTQGASRRSLDGQRGLVGGGGGG